MTDIKNSILLEKLRRASIVNAIGPDHITLSEIREVCAEAYTVIAALPLMGVQQTDVAELASTEKEPRCDATNACSESASKDQTAPRMRMYRR